jgi:hypothetical protein
VVGFMLQYGAGAYVLHTFALTFLIAAIALWLVGVETKKGRRWRKSVAAWRPSGGPHNVSLCVRILADPRVAPLPTRGLSSSNLCEVISTNRSRLRTQASSKLTSSGSKSDRTVGHRVRQSEGVPIRNESQAVT